MSKKNELNDNNSSHSISENKAITKNSDASVFDASQQLNSSQQFNLSQQLSDFSAQNETVKKPVSKRIIIAAVCLIALIMVAASSIAVFFIFSGSSSPEKAAAPAEIKQWISDSIVKEELTKEEVKSIKNRADEDDFFTQWQSALFLAVNKTSLDKDAVADTLSDYTSLYKQVFSESDKINAFVSYSNEFADIVKKTEEVKTRLGYMPHQTKLSQGEFYVYKKFAESDWCDTLKNINDDLKKFSQTEQGFWLGSEIGYDDYWQICPTGERYVFISVPSTFPKNTDYTLTYEYTGKKASVKDTDGKTYSCSILRVVADPDAHNSATQIVEEINNSFYNAIAKMTTSMVKMKDGSEAADLCAVYNKPFEDGGSMDLTVSQANGILSARFSGKYYDTAETLTEVMYPNNEDGSSWVTYDIETKEINTEFFFNTDGSISIKTAFLSENTSFPSLNGKYSVVPSGEPVNGYIADKPVQTESNGVSTVYVPTVSSSGSSSSHIDPYSMFGTSYGTFYRVEVGGSVLNVRSGPGKGYSLQTQLADQTDIAVLGIYDGWAYVTDAFRGYQGFSNNTSTYSVEGWVSADYIEIIPYSP